MKASMSAVRLAAGPSLNRLAGVTSPLVLRAAGMDAILSPEMNIDLENVLAAD